MTVQLIVNLTINDHARFNALAAEALEIVANETGTTRYEFFVGGDQGIVSEAYTDEAALLTHMQNVGHILEQMSTCATMDAINVLGDVSDEFKAAMGAMNPTYLTAVGAATVTA